MRYLQEITSLELPGCFAMTETGHGSNVQSLGTLATYDAEDTFDQSLAKGFVQLWGLPSKMAAARDIGAAALMSAAATRADGEAAKAAAPEVNTPRSASTAP